MGQHFGIGTLYSRRLEDLGDNDARVDNDLILDRVTLGEMVQHQGWRMFHGLVLIPDNAVESDDERMWSWIAYEKWFD